MLWAKVSNAAQHNIEQNRRECATLETTPLEKQQPRDCSVVVSMVVRAFALDSVRLDRDSHVIRAKRGKSMETLRRPFSFVETRSRVTTASLPRLAQSRERNSARCGKEAQSA